MRQAEEDTGFLGDICESFEAKRLAHHVKSLVGVSAAVKVLPPGGIERSLGKAKRIVDKRPK